MDLQLEKIKLIEMLLNIKEESVLKKLRKILESQHNTGLTPEQYDIVNQRRENHFSGESKSYTLEEVLENARASKK